MREMRSKTEVSQSGGAATEPDRGRPARSAFDGEEGMRIRTEAVPSGLLRPGRARSDHASKSSQPARILSYSGTGMCVDGTGGSTAFVRPR
jgi:hypothetical protein